MLTRWTISNFKSIREPVTLDLAPLTIFSGINSAGKSTLIQSILMVAQSFKSVVDDEALVLNGQFVQLGRLQDLQHFGYDQAPIEIGFNWSPTAELVTPASLEIHLNARIMKSKRRRLFAKRGDKFHPYVTDTTIGFAPCRLFQDGKVKLKELHIQASDRPVENATFPLSTPLQQAIENGAFSYMPTKPHLATLNPDPRLERVEGVALTNLVPTRLLVSIDVKLNELVTDIEWIISVIDQVSDSGRVNPRNIQEKYLSPLVSDVFRQIELPGVTSFEKWDNKKNSISRFRHTIINHGPGLSRMWIAHQLDRSNYSPYEMQEFRQLLAAALSKYLRDNPPFSSRATQITHEERLLPAEYMAAVNQVQTVMRQQVHFLGPLRDEPRVIYTAPPLSEQWSVGLKGEYTAAILDEYRNMAVFCPLPPTENFAGRYTIKKDSLINAVTVWLQRMGLVESVDTEETPKVGYRLTVNSPGLNMPLDLTSVGVGVSQVLPTLVLALLAPPDSTLIFEQPELHLHPKVQSVLGDFFLGIVFTGKQCIVETHSEHLINRLRLRIVESERNDILQQIRIYFVEKHKAVSRFREVKSNAFGALLEWPEGFFDEAENTASKILEAQMRRQFSASQKNIFGE